MYIHTLLLLLLTCIIGMLLNRLSLLRFFLRYEILFLIISLSTLLLNTTTYEMLLVVYPIRNPTFEVIMALSVVLIQRQTGIVAFNYLIQNAMLGIKMGTSQ